MTSATSSCKLPSKALLLVNIKRFIWLPLLNLLGLILFIPVIILNRGPVKISQVMENPENFLNWSGQAWFNEIAYNPFVMLMLIGVGLLWAALLYNYLNETRSVTFFHSLPFNRRTLFWNLNFAGAVGMLIPIIITAIICILIRFVGNIGLIYGIQDILTWIVTYFIMEMVIFSSAVFVGMVTGLPLVQPIFTVIMHLLPAALFALTTIVMHLTIYGFPNYSSQMDWVEYLPIVRLFMIPIFGVSTVPNRGVISNWAYMGIMVLLIAAFLLIGLLLYKKRPMERTGDIIVFSVLKPIFKYGVTYCAMLTGSFLLSEIINEQIQAWMLIFWSVIGYCLAEMLLQKTVRIFKSWKGLAVYITVLLILTAGNAMDITGYQRRIPEQNQIAAVYINGSAKTYPAVQALDKLAEQGIRIVPQLVDQLDPRLCFREEANIAAMRNIHQHLIDKRDSYSGGNNWRNQKITYVLKDGSRIVRQYNLNLADYPQEAKALYESAEYKTYRRNIAFAQAEDLYFLRIGNDRRQGTDVELFTAQEINGFLQALKKDIQSEPFESMEGNNEYFLRVDYRYNVPELDWAKLQEIAPQVFNEELKQRIQEIYSLDEEETRNFNQYKYNRYNSIGIMGNYENTLNWLKENGYWEKLLPDAKNFTEVRLYESYNVPGALESEKYYWEKQLISRESYEMNPIFTEEAQPVEIRPIDENRFVSIKDPVLIEKIIKDDSYKPYYLPFGAKYKDKKVYCVDFYDDRKDYVFTGYYYEGLPDFLTGEAARITENNRQN